MARPLYKGLDRPVNAGDAHQGLWFDRFFDRYDNILQDNIWRVSDQAKREWIATVKGESCGARDALRLASQEQHKLCLALGGEARVFKTSWHFVTGLGYSHPVENGFAWHPTLGTPYLPGSAVKGLVRAWIEAWDGSDETQRKEKLLRWFGGDCEVPEGEGRASQAGAFIFFDALPTAPVTLACDIMTPHMGDWYAKGGEIKDVNAEANAVPADWHNPIPVPFLVVKEAAFLFSVAPRTGQAKAELAEVMRALSDALEFLGAGAKTAVGYGRFAPDQRANRALDKTKKDVERAAQSDAERLRDEIRTCSDKKLAEMFGKGFNKTEKDDGEEKWKLRLQIFLEEKRGLIDEWKKVGKDTAEGKAYRNLLNKAGLLG